MRRVRSANTGLEQKVRVALRAANMYYRVQVMSLPGRPDFYIPRLRVALFVNGCFWHSHDCRLGRRPKTNVEFWASKLTANSERDARVRENLEKLGVKSVTIWQCEITLLGAEIARLSCDYKRADLGPK